MQVRKELLRARHIAMPLRIAVMKRDGSRCVRCGKTSPLNIHHIIPWDDGGLTVESNLVVLCETCHDIVEPQAGVYNTRALIENLPIPVQADDPLEIKHNKVLRAEIREKKKLMRYRYDPRDLLLGRLMLEDGPTDEVNILAREKASAFKGGADAVARIADISLWKMENLTHFGEQAYEEPIESLRKRCTATRIAENHLFNEE